MSRRPLRYNDEAQALVVERVGRVGSRIIIRGASTEVRGEWRYRIRSTHKVSQNERGVKGASRRGGVGGVSTLA